MSSPVYLQLGVSAQDGIVLQTPAGAFTTGKVDANFTKKLTKNTTGNQSVTGITVTEVDGTNNAGQYAISIASSSIPLALGTYQLLVYLTADPTYSFEAVYYVTPTGLPGSTGPLSFTSTTNNGRVSDGTTGISGATVTLINGSYIVQTTSDANGQWGPIAFPASFGTVAISVTKSGYTLASGSLTVGAASVTGPGTDLVLAAVSSGTTILASTLWAYARRQSGNKTGTQADARIKQAVNDALDRYASAYKWNWYWRRGTLSVNAAYTTGTITLTNGATTAVLAGGTFPTWAGVGRLFINGQILDVQSRTDGTNLVLTGAWNGTTASYSYVLFNDSYVLPTNFFEFGRIFEGQKWPYMGVPISIQEFWARQNAYTIGSNYAWCFAIAYGKIFLGPYPTTSLSAAFSYRARPVPLVSDSDVADVDPVAIGCLEHFIDYFIARAFGDSVAGDPDKCWERVEEALESSIANDKSATQGAVAGGQQQRQPAPMWVTKTTPT